MYIYIYVYIYTNMNIHAPLDLRAAGPPLRYLEA